MSETTWIPTEWQRESDLKAFNLRGPIIRRHVSPFYEGVRFAVADSHGSGAFVLNKSLEWEYEPLPSSRDDSFYARCRFDSFEEATAAAGKVAR